MLLIKKLSHGYLEEEAQPHVSVPYRMLQSSAFRPSTFSWMACQ